MKRRGLVSSLLPSASSRHDRLEGKLMVGFLGGPLVMKRLFEGIIAGDMMLAFISLCLTWTYTLYHTKSFFLASAGMFHLVMSFPLAIFLCRKKPVT